MSQRALRLPIRSLTNVRRSEVQWTCRRCLATQLQQPSPSSPTAQPPRPQPRDLRHLKDPSDAENYDPKLPFSQRDYRLKKSDYFLKRALPHEIPSQYLQHSTTDLLHFTEREQREKTKPHKPIVGVVVSAQKMDKTVKVRVPRMTFNKKIKKHFRNYDQHLVHDPNNSLVIGDVISLHRLHVSTRVFHVVASIVAPFGTPIESRPPIPSADERLAAYKEKRLKHLHRRYLRRRAAMGNADAVAELREMGLDSGDEADPGQGATLNSGKGAREKQKGQKLPGGVLQGRKAEMGKINDRAQRNKGMAMKLERQAEGNILEAKKKAEDLARQGVVTTETTISVQNPVLDPPETSQKPKAPRKT